MSALVRSHAVGVVQRMRSAATSGLQLRGLHGATVARAQDAATAPTPAPATAATAAPVAAAAAAVSSSSSASTAPSSSSSSRPRSRTSTPPLLLRVPRPPFLFFAAPLEDVSESAWRRLVHASGRGADLTFTEMARVENLARKAASRSGGSWLKTGHALEAQVRAAARRHYLLTPDETEITKSAAVDAVAPLTPTVVQLLVGKEESLRAFLRAFEPTPGSFAGFNLNMGCPAPEVLKLGLGAQAVKRIAKCQRFVEILNEFLLEKCSGPEWDLALPAGVTALRSPDTPEQELTAPMRPGVSIKMRLGANQREKVMGTHINLVRALRGDSDSGSRNAGALDGGRAASSGPVSYFIVHARHGGQHYEDAADLGAVARTILHTGAPNVLVNGDIHTSAQVRRAAEMGAAGVMIGRAAVKDPMIFARLKEEMRRKMPMVPVLDGGEPLALAQPSPSALASLYLSYAHRYDTPEKYRDNVVSRIGKVFEPNPRPDDTARGRRAEEAARAINAQAGVHSGAGRGSEAPPPRQQQPQQPKQTYEHRDRRPGHFVPSWGGKPQQREQREQREQSFGSAQRTSKRF